MLTAKTRASSSRLLLLGSAIAAAVAMQSTALAEQAAKEKDQGLEEVVVTAQFLKQNLQDIPAAITAVTGAMMESRNMTNLAQVADSAPSVTFRPQGASFGPSITASIRGVGQNDFSPAFEPGVGIYIDDVYFPSLTGAVMDLLDLDRVEISRGPQGTLSGRNSEGGSIKLYSRKPTGESGGFTELTLGDNRGIGMRASGDFRLSDHVSARISGVFKRQDGYVDQVDFGCAHPAGKDPLNPVGGIAPVRATGDCVIGKLGGIGYQAVRGILRFTPNDDVDLSLSADFTHDEHTIAGEVLIATAFAGNSGTNAVTLDPTVVVPYDDRFICGKFCNYATLSQPAITFTGLFTPPGGQPLLATSGSNISVYDSYNLGSNLHWNLSSNVSIDNILAYQHFKTSWDSDDDLSPVNLNLGQNRQDHWNWSEELRVNTKFSDSVSAVFGGYYFKQQTNYWSYQDIRYIAAGFAIFPLQFIQPDYVPASSNAAFANLAWKLAPNLNLNAGLRYTEEKKEYHYFRLNPDGTINPYLDPAHTLTGSVAHYKGSKTDYRVALDYRFSPQVMAYASVATGFKGGGTNPRPFNVGQVISFNPETVTNYELGMKTDFLNRRLRLNLTGFLSKIKDVQIAVLACPDSPCAARLNAGEAESKGIEFELMARPVDALTIDASFSLLDWHFTSLRPSAAYPSNSAGASTSDPVAGAPKSKISLGIQYDIPVGNGSSISPRLDYSYQDKIFAGTVVTGPPDCTPVPSPCTRTLSYTPSYGLVNARLTWSNAHKDLDIALGVTNLTDKYYALSTFDLRGLGAGFDKMLPGRPREWSVTAKKTF
jgi:iron complex outermembrane receptor protein